MPKSKKKRGAYTPPFTEAQKKAIIGAYKKDSTLEELADKYGCSTSKIRKVLTGGKVKMRPRGPKADPKASKPKAKKVKKPKAKVKAKPKAKAKVKAKSKASVVAAVDTPKAEAPGASSQRVRKPLTDAQRAAKNARDKERRAAKKAGLNATLAAVGQSSTTA